MFRFSRFLTHGFSKKCTSLTSHQIGYQSLRFFKKNTTPSNEAALLLKLADEFAYQGKVRTSEDVYKSIIEKYPYHQEAYQKLWNSWMRNRSLNVTEKELEDFKRKYDKYINSTINSNHTPKLG